MKNIFLLIVSLLFITNANANSQKSTSDTKIKVACIGNSITQGYGLLFEDSWPIVMRAYFDESKYEIRNYGLGGRTMLKEVNPPFLSYWKESFYTESREWNPDIVIIKLGTNDVKAVNWIQKGIFVDTYKEFVESYKVLESNPEIYVCYPAPIFNFDNGVDDKATIVGELMPMIDRIAEETGSSIIDLHTPFLDKEQFFYDNIHPDYRGSIYLARLVAKAISPEIILPPFPENFLVDVATHDYTDKAVGITSSLGENVDLSAINDNDPQTGITVDNAEIKIDVKLPAKLSCSGYSLSVGKGDVKNFPRSWKLEGSLSGRLWYTIDEQKNRTFDEMETGIFKASTISSYQYFRITFTDNNGGQSFSLSEFQLLGSWSTQEVDITSNGGVISGQYAGYPGELVENLLDKSLQTKYCVVDKNGGWIQYDSPEKVKAGKYIITACGDHLADRNLNSWEFSGSNDGKKWDVLDVRTNENFGGPFHAIEYTVADSKEYSKFRLNITKIKRSKTFQFTRLQIFEKKTSSLNNTVEPESEIYVKDGAINIQTGDSSMKEYVLWNTQGQKVLSGKMNNSAQIAASDKRGIYFIQLSNNYGWQRIDKIILF